MRVVHIAPGHGADDFNLYIAERLGEVPHTVGPDGRYSAPGHTGVFHVVATSAVNPSVSATAVVRVS